MRGRTAAACAALLVTLAGCGDATPDKEAKEASSPRPTIADYVGKTKSEAEDGLSPSMALRAYEDAKTKADRRDRTFDTWIICKQDAHGDGPITFSVAATRAACGLPAASKDPDGSKSPAPSSDASADVPSPSDKNEQYAGAVKVRAPELRQVEADDLGVQGQLVCTELDAGDSPREVLKTIQAAYPGVKGLALVTEAPPVYCPSHEAAVASALK
ncbi:hypothetical protein AB0G60_14530 [Streptomyces angustmyceticus]|uniref:DUF732 domain-containing protein n=1 Tax=Streptomyces angustmyceticus TaxID=285578 RepID=A0A5J4LNP3_9ACTN|nr:hypothetical protein [Streptomyces angustmyceticus]UAL66865.1 hypothetical protein K7396_10185 [Streptomyces angustmyceticus]GES31975.1 hypothetical protein San01_44620 [Streptomyces angustmyceticus]